MSWDECPACMGRRVLNLPSILVAGAVYLLSLVFGREGGLVWLAWSGRHLEA